jgi:hypothetical protein
MTSDVTCTPLICYHNLVPLRGKRVALFYRLYTHILPVSRLQVATGNIICYHNLVPLRVSRLQVATGSDRLWASEFAVDDNEPRNPLPRLAQRKQVDTRPRSRSLRLRAVRYHFLDISSFAHRDIQYGFYDPISLVEQSIPCTFQFLDCGTPAGDPRVTAACLHSHPPCGNPSRATPTSPLRSRWSLYARPWLYR